MRALVVGGTGPTGPYIVQGLLDRGYDVTILHRGTHEIDEIPPEVEHIHVDPHFRETLEPAVEGRSWDLVVATYGRLRFVAEVMVGHCDQFVGVGGIGVYKAFFEPDRMSPPGLRNPTPENAPLVEDIEENRFQFLMVDTERAVLAAHPRASVLRYPYVYGPRQLAPREWSIVRRLLDGREQIVVADGGLSLGSSGYVENLAHAVLLTVDRPDEAAGTIFNCGDETTLSVAQVIESVAAKLGREVELVSIPSELAAPARPLTLYQSGHRFMDIGLIKERLGYEDQVAPTVGLDRTVDWLLANRPEPGGDTEQRLGDPFDYENEDRLIAAHARAMAEYGAVPFDIGTELPHVYAHPKEPGQGTDERGR